MVLAASGDWSYGAAILTFAFPMILFAFVACALYVIFSTPHLVPGHRYRSNGHTVTDTKGPGASAAGTATGGSAGTSEGTE